MAAVFDGRAMLFAWTTVGFQTVVRIDGGGGWGLGG